MASNPIEATLVGGSDLLRAGIAYLIKNQATVSAQYTTVREAYEKRSDLKPELLILVDFPFSTEDEYAALRELKSSLPELRTVVITEHEELESIMLALSAGIDGYILRDTGADTLGHLLHLVGMGECAYSARLLRKFVADNQDHGIPRPPITGSPNFTSEQLAVLHGLSIGLSNKKIADNAGTTDTSVKIQVRSLLKLLGMRNRTQIALWAANNGYGAPFMAPPLNTTGGRQSVG